MDDYCPNCDGRLTHFRTDRQIAGSREVIMHWSICIRCRHVALDNWHFNDVASAASRSGDANHPFSPVGPANSPLVGASAMSNGA